MRQDLIKDLHPVYFSLVMATGIVSVASHFEGFEVIARLLLWVNVAAYLALWALYLVRLFRFPAQFFGDFFSFPRGVGYFTVVAGTCVLGSQINLVGGNPTVAGWLWLFGLVLWPIMNYGIFTCYTVAREKPDLAKGINGGWLVSVVACQGVSLLGSQLAAHFAPWQEFVMFASLIAWLIGAMLYIWIISLIFYRSMFLLMEPAEFSSPYWINMGAAAISTLAGSLLILNQQHSPLVADIVPFVKGFTLFFWATASAWIPQLLVLGFWRYVIRRFPFTYSPMDWGMVFPLGMYTACTHMLAKATQTAWLELVPGIFIYVALLAWTVTLANYVRSWLPVADRS
jgi:tellurite resistance protein TehA-like permease